MGFNTKKVFPENFILLGDSGTQTAKAYSIISDGKVHYPKKFEGNKDYFSFELRYVAPFDKNFHELKRLQGMAAEAAGRRAEFKGYIIINLSEWLTHHDEDYLKKALLFLVDMNDCWKYIFLINDQNLKASKELVGKLLTVFFRNHIICKVEEYIADSSIKNLASYICKEQGVICASHVKETIEELLIQGFEDAIVSALVSEVSWYCGKKISTNSFVGFISECEPSIRYMLPQKEYCRLMSIIEQRKENWYGEKEVV